MLNFKKIIMTSILVLAMLPGIQAHANDTSNSKVIPESTIKIAEQEFKRYTSYTWVRELFPDAVRYDFLRDGNNAYVEVYFRDGTSKTVKCDLIKDGKCYINDTSDLKEIPKSIALSPNFTKIIRNSVYNLALDDCNNVWDLKDLKSNSQIKIKNLNNVIDIQCGEYHVATLKKDSTVCTLGKNDYGQLGNGNKLNSTLPIQVKNLDNVINIKCGKYHTVVLKKDGTVWAWGKNNYGQLGNGNKLDSTLPVQVKNLDNVIDIQCGKYYNLALKKDGTVWAWGKNNYGQLGNGNKLDSNLPIQVKNLNNITDIKCGSYHNIALEKNGTIWIWFCNDINNMDKSKDNTNIKEIGIKFVDTSDGITETSNVITVDAIHGNNFLVDIEKDGTVWSCSNTSLDFIGNFKGDTNINLPTKVKKQINLITSS